MNPLYPIQFEPILKPKVWGGRRLERLGKQLPPATPIGESWEIADLPPSIPEGRSVIENGDLAGLTLHEAIGQHRDLIIGRASLSEEGGFPLLIKYLDASEDLSVQVHPDEAYAAAHPEAHLKSEAWVVVEAEPGAVIYKGLREGVTPESFRRHIETGEVVDDLVSVAVKPGDCHYLPSGTCHALGAGVLVAEVQTPSDTTFRVYDWGRPQSAGRELHLDQALQCIRFGEPVNPLPEVGAVGRGDGYTSRTLCETEYFQIERIEAVEGSRLELVTNAMPLIVMVLNGEGVFLSAEADEVRFTAGATTLLPARIKDGAATFDKRTDALLITLPSITRGLLA